MTSSISSNESIDIPNGNHLGTKKNSVVLNSSKLSSKKTSSPVDQDNDTEARNSKRHKTSSDADVVRDPLDPPSSPLISMIKSAKRNEEELELLKQKLRNRIAEMRQKRKADQTAERKKQTQSEVPQASPAKRQRKERKRKSSEEKKETKKEEKRTESEEKRIESEEKRTESEGEAHSDADLTPKRISLDSSLDEADLQYSTFTFGPEKPVPTYLLPKRKKSNSKLLKEVEKNKAIAAADPEYETKMLYEAAVKRAKGERVRDDPQLLKKTLKREQKRKQKSAKDWQKRKNEQQSAMEEKQRQRSENIKQHIEKKRQQQLSTKPKDRPGFEGESFRKPRTNTSEKDKHNNQNSHRNSRSKSPNVR